MKSPQQEQLRHSSPNNVADILELEVERMAAATRAYSHMKYIKKKTKKIKCTEAVKQFLYRAGGPARRIGSRDTACNQERAFRKLEIPQVDYLHLKLNELPHITSVKILAKWYAEVPKSSGVFITMFAAACG